MLATGMQGSSISTHCVVTLCFPKTSGTARDSLFTSRSFCPERKDPPSVLFGSTSNNNTNTLTLREHRPPSPPDAMKTSACDNYREPLHSDYSPLLSHTSCTSLDQYPALSPSAALSSTCPTAASSPAAGGRWQPSPSAWPRTDGGAHWTHRTADATGLQPPPPSSHTVCSQGAAGVEAGPGQNGRPAGIHCQGWWCDAR